MLGYRHPTLAIRAVEVTETSLEEEIAIQNGKPGEGPRSVEHLQSDKIRIRVTAIKERADF
jgi:hypothetical protein